jgi:photosystem II reaction center protein PsbP
MSFKPMAVIILLLIFSVPLTIGVLSNNLPSLLHSQQAIAQKTATTMSSFLTYHNSTYGINIQYPSDWLYKGSEISNDSVQSIVTFASPTLFTSNSNKSVPVVTVGIEKLSFYNVPLDLYTNLTINHLRKSELGFSLLGSSDVSFAGIKPAHKIVFTSDSGRKTMAVYAIKGDKAYIIDYIAESDSTYSNYGLIAQKMIDSFQILK